MHNASCVKNQVNRSNSFLGTFPDRHTDLGLAVVLLTGRMSQR